MKIVILSCFNPLRGGIAQSNDCMRVSLSAMGHEVKAFNFKRLYPSILFPGKSQEVSPEEKSAGGEFSVRILDSIRPISWIRTFRAVLRYKPDLLIVRNWTSFLAPSLGFVARKVKKIGIPVVGMLDNAIPHEKHFFDVPLMKYFTSGCNALVSFSGAVSEDLRKTVGVKVPVKELFLPINDIFTTSIDKSKAREMLGLDSGRKTLLFFGLIRQYKGLDILLKAFSSLGEDYQLIIAGEPYGSFEPYQEIIDSIPGMSSRIKKVLEFIPNKDVAKYFCAADLAVLPYRSATQSGISITAYTFGLPVVCTGVGGLMETMGNRGTALIAQSCTPEAIKECIERFFAEPDIRQGCLENIQKEKRRLSWSNFCSELFVFLNEVKLSNR